MYLSNPFLSKVSLNILSLMKTSQDSPRNELTVSIPAGLLAFFHTLLQNLLTVKPSIRIHPTILDPSEAINPLFIEEYLV